MAIELAIISIVAIIAIIVATVVIAIVDLVDVVFIAIEWWYEGLIPNHVETESQSPLVG